MYGYNSTTEKSALQPIYCHKSRAVGYIHVQIYMDVTLPSHVCF